MSTPTTRGSTTTRARLVTIWPGCTCAWPTSRERIGPATATVATVEPTRTPAESAASPPAMAVVATDAISHGARPTVSTPLRSDPAARTRDAAHARAGSTVTPAPTTTTRDRH